MYKHNSFSSSSISIIIKTDRGPGLAGQEEGEGNPNGGREGVAKVA